MGFTLSGITIDGAITLTSAFVPNAPTIGTAARVSGSATEIDVPFTASSNNGNSVILSYTAVSTPDSITGTLSQASSGTIRVSGLTTGTSYTFVVYATNGVGNSPNSAASNAVIPLSVPTAPTIGTVIRVSGSGTQLDVPYTASSSNGGNAITSYTAVSTPDSITGTLSQASSGTIRVSGLTQGTSYTFVVYATNGVGNSPNSATSNSLAPAVVPTAPTIGTASVLSNTSASVSYTASSSNGGNTITSYTAVSTPGSITGTISQASSGSITVTGLTQGTSYTFRVYATNAVGNSPNSAASNAVAPANAPSQATVGTVTSTYGLVSVPFTAPANGGNAITTHTAISYPDSITASVSQASSGTITYSNNSNLIKGQIYTFKVYATNAVGNGTPSTASNTITYDGNPEQESGYLIPGTYTWVAPAGVTSVSTVAIGGGGGGGSGSCSPCGPTPGQAVGAGGGAGLGYKNAISVTSGSSYTVVAASGGSGGNNSGGASGGQSYFINTSTVAGNGGTGGTGRYGQANAAGGGHVGDGGGTGGHGLYGSGGWQTTGGGGGAGGYSGNGANGSANTVSALSGAGGGGGGGVGSAPFSSGGGGGGGTGLYGEGPSGAGGSGAGVGGGGGSSGSNGTNGGNNAGGVLGGGLYGGGGGGWSRNNPAQFGGRGGNGAVRIIWGTGRSFPSTNANVIFTGNVPGTPTIGTVTTSPSTVTVPFTAASNGGNTITSHRAISTPGNVVATLNQASSGSIVYSSDTLLSNNTAYTFKVYAVNSVGAGPQSSASNSITYIV